MDYQQFINKYANNRNNPYDSYSSISISINQVDKSPVSYTKPTVIYFNHRLLH